MIDIEFDLSGCEKACVFAQRALVTHVRVAVYLAAKEGVEEAKTRRRYKDRTGGLTRDAYSRMLRYGPKGAEAIMAWPAKYASFVEEGTPAHDIYPKVAAGTMGPLVKGQGRRSRGKARKMLAWSGPGGVHFASKVHHPGTSPYGFAAMAYEKAQRVLIREIEIGALLAEAAFNRR